MLSMHRAFHFFGHSVEKGSERKCAIWDINTFPMQTNACFKYGNWKKQHKSALPKCVLLPWTFSIFWSAGQIVRVKNDPMTKKTIYPSIWQDCTLASIDFIPGHLM